MKKNNVAKNHIGHTNSITMNLMNNISYTGRSNDNAMIIMINNYFFHWMKTILHQIIRKKNYFLIKNLQKMLNWKKFKYNLP
jgi:hypothetical protein